MVSPKYKNKILWVKAVNEANVKEIDENGKPLMGMRIIGKNNDSSIIENGVKISYHSHYIARLKEKALLPMDKETAILAGVSFDFIPKKGK